MTIPIEKKAPLLEEFYLRLEDDGWNFNDCTYILAVFASDAIRLADQITQNHSWTQREGCDLAPGIPSRDCRVQASRSRVSSATRAPHRYIADSLSNPSRYKTAISDITKKMGAGMSRYAKFYAESGGKFSVDTLASFDLYCHFVAGLVGEGLSRLFSASQKESEYLGEQLTLSNSMGLMLQKTNILRDFREDCDEGRVFWPAEIWNKYVEKPEDLYKAGNEEKALWALSEMTVDALSHATDALDYLTLLSNQSVFNFCAIPQVMAIATLETCFMNPQVMQRNVKIRKGAAVQVSGL